MGKNLKWSLPIASGTSLLLTITAIYAWVTWPERVIDRFLSSVKTGDWQTAKEFLGPTTDDSLFIDNHALAIAARRGVTPLPRTALDLLLGRRRFDAHLAYANDHSFTVQCGRVSLGRSYFLYFVPGPDFSGARR